MLVDEEAQPIREKVYRELYKDLQAKVCWWLLPASYSFLHRGATLLNTKAGGESIPDLQWMSTVKTRNPFCTFLSFLYPLKSAFIILLLSLTLWPAAAVKLLWMFTVFAVANVHKRLGLLDYESVESRKRVSMNATETFRTDDFLQIVDQAIQSAQKWPNQCQEHCNSFDLL
jgi:hypothetical protein